MEEALRGEKLCYGVGGSGCAEGGVKYPAGEDRDHPHVSVLGQSSMGGWGHQGSWAPFLEASPSPQGRWGLGSSASLRGAGAGPVGTGLSPSNPPFILLFIWMVSNQDRVHVGGDKRTVKKKKKTKKNPKPNKNTLR